MIELQARWDGPSIRVAGSAPIRRADDVLERPAVPPPFPAVHEMPPQRTNSVLTDEERRKAEEDLVTARERQPGRAKAKAAPAKG